jgi:hypothetical protein
MLRQYTNYSLHLTLSGESQNSRPTFKSDTIVSSEMLYFSTFQIIFPSRFMIYNLYTRNYVII